MDPGPRFEEHIKTAHPFECEHCDLRYVEEEKLRKHKRSHQKGKVKGNKDELQKVERVKEESVTGGENMDEQQVELVSKKKNASMKNSNKPKGANLMSALALRLPKSKEEERSKSVDSITVVANFWKCNHCEAPFPTEPDMKNHQEKTHAQACRACSMKFIHAIEFKRHQVDRHNSVSKGITKCVLCREPTEDKSLASHKKAKHAFQCSLCDLKFVQKTKLWKHMIEEHGQGTWVNRPDKEAMSKNVPGTHDDLKNHPSIPKLVEVERAMKAVKKKDEKIFPRKISKLKEEKWETVKDKKVRADESREKLAKCASGGAASNSGAKASNLGVKATNTGVKGCNSGVNSSTSGLKASTSGVKVPDSTEAKASKTGGLKATNTEGRTGDKKLTNEVCCSETEKLEECRMCKEVCFLLICLLLWIAFTLPF